MLDAPEVWAEPEERAEAAREIVERLAMACLRENLCEAQVADDRLVLKSNSGGTLALELKRRHCMTRFDLAALPKELEPDTAVESFLGTLFAELPSQKQQSLLAELQCSYLNLALSLKAKKVVGVGEPGEGDLADWEGRVWCGHPLHPGARLRSGVSAKENRLYGPEWGARLKLPLVSVPRESAVEVGNFAARLASLYPGIPKAEAGRVHLPVHPWQAEHDLTTRFGDRFQSGEFQLTHHTLAARPTMSFRTVILSTEVGQDFHLKLPVAVQTTGATRTVSVASTQNGPLMSAFIGRLFALPEFTRSQLFAHLHLMAEPGSFYIKSESEDRSRFFSAILRLGPGQSRLAEKRWVLPVAALLEPRENPLFLRVASHFGVSPLTLFENYCRRLLPAQAYLCGQLGIALEAHPQNMLVDFRGFAGSPPDIHFYYRDLGGIRLHPARLREALQKRGWDQRLDVPKFWPGSATSTDSDRDLSSKFVYSLLQNHLGELIRSVVRLGQVEADWWSAVDDILTEQKALLGKDLAARVFAQAWDLKAMWTMRLDSAITEYTFSPVGNPLLQFRKELSR